MPKTAGENLREALIASKRVDGHEINDPRRAGRNAMSDIDPQEFGRLQAQVETLIQSDKEKTALLTKMAESMAAIQLQLAEAKGGWKVLVMLGGASATLGSFLTWALTHFKWGS